MNKGKGLVDLGTWGQVGVLEAAAGADSVQKGLASARAQLGHALCLCTQPPRRLQVRRRGQRLHLAVWPDDGDEHAEQCPFRRVHTHDQAQAECPAIVQREDGLSIKLQNGLIHWVAPDNRARRDTKAEAEGEPKEKGEASKTPTAKGVRGLTLLGLWDLLWRQAGLAEWKQGWKRDYWRVATNLTRAVVATKVGDVPLADILQVVPPWREATADATRAIWEAFDASLDRKPGEPTPSRLVLGEIDTLRKSAFGWQMRLRHTRPPIYVDDELRAKWAKAWPGAVESLNHDPGAGDPGAATSWRRVLVLMQIVRSQRGNLIAVAGHLVPVDPHYFACDSLDEARLVDALIAQGRHFGERPLAALDEDRTEGLPFAHFELYDTEPITPLAVVVQLAPAMESRVQCEAEDGSPWWVWEVVKDSTLPALPVVSGHSGSSRKADQDRPENQEAKNEDEQAA